MNGLTYTAAAHYATHVHSPRQNPNHPIRHRLLQLQIGGVRPRRRQGQPTHPAEPRRQFPGARSRLARVLPAGRVPPVQARRTAGSAKRADFQSVDVDSLELVRPRSVGVEHVGLWAMEQVGLPTLLARLGLGAKRRAAALGSIIGRMAAPDSERATQRWLGGRSDLGELAGRGFRGHGRDPPVPRLGRFDGEPR